MFQASKKRFRALLALVDDVLGDPEPLAALGGHEPGGALGGHERLPFLGDPELPTTPHPHRRPIRIEAGRRNGSVAPRPTHCLSPVRHNPERGRRDRVT